MFFFNKNTNKKEHHFGLFLKGDEAVAFLFEIEHEQINILAHEQVPYTNGWENVLQDVDDAFTKLETSTRLHPKKIIFFLYSYFIDQEKVEIKEPYKGIIKSISKQMDLAPLGYIECCEAVASYLERRDKSPLNVILVELDKKNIDICIYKGSRRVITKSISRTDSLVQDLSSVFAQIKHDVLLPSRLVLYDSSDLDGNSAAILSHKWEKDTFVQHPRVEVIKEQDLYQELANIFAYQLYGVAEKQPLAVSALPPQPTPVEEVVAQPPPTSAPQLAQDVSAESLGFVVHEDVPSTQVQTAAPAVPVTPSKPKTAFAPKMPSIHFPRFAPTARFNAGGGKLLLILGLLMISAGLFLLEYQFHKATLTILVPSKQLDKKFQLSNIVVQISTASASVQESAQTTGKRDIGEKARGEVTIHNFDDKIRVIAKGTTFEVDGHAFTLDTEVTVASASEVLSDSGPVKQTGKAKANITATTIGPESNLEKNKRLKIADLPTSLYFAQNESAFSGGTKKSIRTVAKRDIDELQKTLLEKGKKEAIENIKKNLQDKQRVLDQLTEVKPANVNPSKEVGEESDQITVVMNVSATYYYVNDSEVKDSIYSRLQSDVPQGFELDKNKITYMIDQVKNTSGSVTMDVDVKANTTKTLKPQEIAQKVKGQKKDNLKSILEKESQVSGYVVDVSSPVPILSDWTPFFQKNIDVRLSTL